MWAEHQPKWTIVFIAASIIVYLLQQGTRIWVYLAFTPALIIRYPWTIVTSLLLHVDFSHLLFNMFALFLFGTALERRISPRLYVTLFILSGVVGNIGYYFKVGNHLIPVLGASGAIYGVIGRWRSWSPSGRCTSTVWCLFP